MCLSCQKQLITKTVSKKNSHKRKWPLPKTPVKRLADPSDNPSKRLDQRCTPQKEQQHESPLSEESIFEPLSEPAPSDPVFPAKSKRGFKELACSYIHDGKYQKAFNVLIRESESARTALLDVFEKHVHKEVLDVITGHKEFKTLAGPLDDHKSLESIKWDGICAEGGKLMPFLSRAITTSMPATEKLQAQVSKGRRGAKRLFCR